MSRIALKQVRLQPVTEFI